MSQFESTSFRANKCDISLPVLIVLGYKMIVGDITSS